MSKNGMTFDQLLSHYHHQDNLMWKSVAWAIPLEAATFVASAVGDYERGALALGTLLLICLAGFTLKSGIDQHAVKRRIDRFGKDVPGYRDFPLAKNLSCWCFLLKGRVLLGIAFFAIISANIWLLITMG